MFSSMFFSESYKKDRDRIVKREINIPTPNVSENPFIGPDPIKNKIIAANNVVMFASNIAVLDFT